MKAGRKPEARESLSRYLQLAPDAPDRKYVERYLNMLKNRGRTTMRKLCIVTPVLLIAGCATGPAVQADKTEVAASDKSFVVTLPGGVG